MTTARLRPMISAVLMTMATLAMLVACAIPVDESPEALAVDQQRDLIFGTTTSTIASTDTVVNRRLFYVLDSGFQSVVREYGAQIGGDPLLSSLLTDLAVQPSQEEVEQFADIGALQSLVPANLNASVSEREGEQTSTLAIVTVDGEGGLRDALQAGEREAALAVGQIVCTVIENNTEIESVEIQAPSEDGQFERLRLFDRDLQIIEGPATAADFGDCQTVQDTLANQDESSSSLDS